MNLQRLSEAANLVGDRWTLLVLAVLVEAPATFTDLQGAIPGISPAVLSARLRDLEKHGLVLAVPYQARPVRHRYEPTARAVALSDALRALAAWAGAEVAHERCGTQASLRWWCPTCETPVSAGESDLYRF